MNDKLIIKTDITDWQEEALRNEVLPKDEDEIIDHLRNGESTSFLARAAIVSREMGKAKGDIIRPNKVLLNIGAQLEISTIAKKQTVEVTTPEGRTYEIPALVGKGHINETLPEQVDFPESEDDQNEARTPSYVTLDDPLALTRAEHYLEKVIGGHIWNRLLTISKCGGDVIASAEALKEAIDGMIDRIV